jgi:hypothetical protein
MPKDKTTPTSITVSLILDKDQVAVLQRAFPNGDDKKTASAIVHLAATEFIELLAGKRRYTSLTNQYIEWVDKIYSAALPDTEFTYRQISDGFSFPPGTAAYIARVLRDRQYTSLQTRAKEQLRLKLLKELAAYDNLPAERKPSLKMRNLRLTAREYALLQMIVDDLILGGEPLEIPDVTSRSRELVFVSVPVDFIKPIVSKLSEV